MSQFSLSEVEVNHYRTEGYLVVEKLLSAADLPLIAATIRAWVDRTVAGEDLSAVLELAPVDGHRVARRIYNPYDQHEAFRALATDPRLFDKIESPVGPAFNLQHSKLNIKPARVGSVVDWHQDLACFPHTNDDLVTALVYLDDATEENGCLQVLPRHHHHYFNHTTPDGKFSGMISEDLDSGRFGRPVPLAAPAGSAILMHCITPHSALLNRSSRPRRMLIYEYRANDAFPIWYGLMTSKAEAHYRPVRRKPAQYARFGGPPPLVPMVDEYASLYELQARSKAKGTTA